MAAKEATYQGTLSLVDRKNRPNFGFRWEHDGEKTLKDFFIENGMTIPTEINPNREEPPFCKDIEWCGNYGCAFNGAFDAEKGRCTSDIGQCYGYIELVDKVKRANIEQIANQPKVSTE